MSDSFLNSPLEHLNDAVVPGGGFVADRSTDGSQVFTPGGQPIRAYVGVMNLNQQKIAGRPYDAQFMSLAQAIRARHTATGIQPATILNFLPIPLVVNSPMQDLKVRIPPAPVSAEETDLFSFHTWYDPAIETMERGEGIKQPWDYVPVQIAQAFLDEYKTFGGVVLLRGIPDHATLRKPEVVAAIQEARETMVAWMLSKVEEANGEWNTANRSGARNIVELHRQCARSLKDQGIIDELPEWITESRSLKEVTKKCGNCASQPLPGATECIVCHWILDPAGAFMKGSITEEDASLERLTRAQVEELGISAYVAETIDEKPERLKRGAPKPASIAQMRAMEAEYGSDPEPPSETGGAKRTVPAL